MSEYQVAQALSFLSGTQGKEAGLISVANSGFLTVNQGDINGDGINDFLAAAPIEGGGVKVYVIFGGPGVVGPNSIDVNSLNGSNGFVIEINEPLADNTIVSISAFDINGDGIGDIHITATHPGQYGYNDKTIYHVMGQKSWSASGGTFNVADLNGTNGYLNVLQVYDETYSETATGDVDGDGFEDSVHTYDYGYEDYSYDEPSGAYVVLDQSVSNPSEFDGTNGFRIFVGTDVGPVHAATGDFNHDGIVDIVLTAPLDDAGGTNAGAAYVVFGSKSPFPTTFDVATLDGLNGFSITGAPANAELGSAVCNIGDFNGDGIDDICVGASQANECYVVFGTTENFGPGGCDVSALDGTNGCVIEGINPGDECGYSVCGAGDWNGDGFGDLIIGAPGANTDTGECYVVFGRATCPAVIQCSDLDGDNGFTIIGEASGDRAGSCVDPGDFTGDGFADVGLAAPGAGSAYIIYGGKPGEAVNRTGTDIGQTIRGGDFSDTISGLGGNDRLVGYGGNDTLNGGTGLDLADYSDKTSAVSVTLNGVTPVTVTVGAETDTISSIEGVIGGSGADTLTGDSLKNTFQGRGGKDTLDGGAGSDTADYTEKTAKIFVFLADGPIDSTVNINSASSANVEDTLRNIENVIGSNLDDFFGGNSQNNFFVGGAGKDAMSGGAGRDTLQGGSGDDTLAGDGGKDTLDGGDGEDVADYSLLFGGAAIECTLNGAGNAIVTIGGVAEDTIRNIEDIWGSSGNNRFTGDALNNVFRPGSGNNTINGGGGVDTMEYRNSGDPVVVTLNGSNDVTVTMAGIAKDTIRNIENVFGGSGADSFTGDTRANIFDGRNGNDTISSGGGNDTIVATPTPGNLTGDDVYNGGNGIDTITFANATTQAITVNLAAASNQATGGTSIGTDQLSNIENVIGGNANDIISGSAAANLLAGGAGSDQLTGARGADTLDGGLGTDTMRGGAGNDTYIVDVAGDVTAESAHDGTDTVQSFVSRALGNGLENLTLLAGALNGAGNAANNVLIGNNAANILTGKVGVDTMTGNGGADRFDFDALTHSGVGAGLRDIIADFNAGSAATVVDIVDLRDIDANALVAGNQKFGFIGEAASFASNSPGKVRFEHIGGTTTVLSLNTDNDVDAEMQIEFTGLITFATGDILL